MSGKLDHYDHPIGGDVFSLGHGLAATGTTIPATGEAAAPIDLQSLLRRCLDDATFCGMILHKFAARASDQLAALQRALDSSNIVELAREAHTLAGVAANLSAVTLRDRADELERAAAGNNLAAAREAFERTRIELVRCAAQVPRLIERISGR